MAPESKRLLCHWSKVKMGWQRSKEGYPRIWANFTCEKTKQRFIIKDLSAEYYDIALGYMTNIFRAGPSLGILEEPVSRLHMQNEWLRIMKSNMAIICCTDDEELPRVTAIQFTVVWERGQEQNVKDPSTLNRYERITQAADELMAAGDFFNRFKADQYLFSRGLFVLPEFRRLGIATHLLKARVIMCRALGLPGTADVFSTEAAEAAARSAGFQEFSRSMFNGRRLAVMGTTV